MFEPQAQGRPSAGEVFLVFLRLGCASFGGPTAHIGYFKRAFVDRRQWLTADRFGELVALCQFLPGPASSQLGFAIGWGRAGFAGALAAFVGFTLPSALIMTTAGLVGLSRLPAGLVQGLAVAALAVAGQAAVSLARTFARGPVFIAVMVAALMICLVWREAQAPVILAAGAVGAWTGRRGAPQPAPSPGPEGPGTLAASSALALFVLLLALSLVGVAFGAPGGVRAFATFYGVGALVFGGGHVVLPLLQRAVVAPGLVPLNLFLGGYGLAQALPGPLFTIAAFLGAAGAPPLGGVGGAVVALLAIFLPGFLLLIAAMPAWGWLRARPWARGAVAGAGAAVPGLILAALLAPQLSGRLFRPEDLLVAGVLFLALERLRAPPLAVAAAAAGWGVLRAALPV